MNKSETFFTEAKAAEILELAARYYNAENQLQQQKQVQGDRFLIGSIQRFCFPRNQKD